MCVVPIVIRINAIAVLRAKGGNCTARARELSYTAGDRVTNRKHIYSHSIIVIQSPRNLQEFDKVPQFFGGSKRTLVVAWRVNWKMDYYVVRWKLN